ncbi:uncharacterized protein YjeT (DUF2065 family) [Natronocella acetinitrilica]|uniref:Uncharacterized protein YjeT (DUF2065 family) n=1 Tax=Natronocella acetinitrilica TaxID=414046 RepID=A0AAE3G3A3_9GAMM|nr:DUF2065 domain-containing protein [Natronocella acetinitrilica]MCP1675016.1 uncharacterized protein YjeT (DUF2065 family) [Natronocella acetinitrilica]
MASWEYLLIGLGLMLVFEGIMPFLSPATLRQYMRQIIELDDRSLRIAGLVAMLTGLAILYLIRP